MVNQQKVIEILIDSGWYLQGVENEQFGRLRKKNCF